MQRREFLASGLAAGAVATAGPALAQNTSPSVYTLPREYLPQIVPIKKGHRPYEIHVDPNRFALFLILPDNKAIRYTVGIGRLGLYESGEFYVGAKKEWPSWTPTPAMIAREPEHYGPFAGGVPGGPSNPLGARALYLFQPGKGDTFLRIHGTNDPRTIGKRVSNGCARLINDHVVDLYNRVPLNVRVFLYPAT